MIFQIIIMGFLGIVDQLISYIPTVQPIGIFQNGFLIDFTDLVFENLGLINLVIPIHLMNLMIITMIALMIAKWTWAFIMFVMHKVPLLNIR